ncbi:MCE family protein [Rhodococcus sp. I2R]|uniref:MCE family protein n=1 Tax=Rhodococcus sp. I2R TaxID=2855445 RepID=UPI001E4F9667|nr:MCE family protein [Rhodococcus sp. I2R]MCC8926621.1 MCE family protein [Rhodococcus sp. I2R]
MRRSIVTALSVLTIVAVAGTAASATGVMDIRTRTSSVCAEFTDTVGLYEGNSVTMLGVEVGTVTRIESADTSVVVTMDVDDTVTLPADVGAVTLSGSIVTDRRVEFTRPYTGGPSFDRASCIPLERTRTPLGISETLDAVEQLASDLLGPPDEDGQHAEVLGDTLRAVDGSFQGSGAQLNAALEQLAELVGEPADRDTTVRRLIDNLDGLIETFAVSWPAVAKLLDNLTAGMITLSEFTQEFASAVLLTVDFLPPLTRTIEKYDEKVYGALDQLMPIVEVALGRVGDIKDILEQVPSVSENLMTMYDSDLRSGRLIYRPPQFEIDTNSPNEVCALLNMYSPTCSADQQRGDVIDVGLVQLILGSAGWR